MTNELGLLDRLLHALEKEYEARARQGIHYSELIYCPRQALLRRLDPKPLTIRTMMFFFIGECVHRGIEHLLKKYYPDEVEIEKAVQYKGLIGTMDSIINKTVCEYKTSWSSKPEMKQQYRDQAEGYIAMSDAEQGKVMIIMLMWILKGKIPFQIHELKMAGEDKKKRLEWIESETISYKNALDKNDWTLARAVKNTPMEWKCSKGTEYECPYLKQCWEWENEKTA